MYAERMNGGRFNPGSLGVALGINAVFVGALLYAAPDILPLPPRPPTIPLVEYKPTVTPPPEKPQPRKRTEAQPTEARPLPPVERIPVYDPIVPSDPGFTLDPGPVGAEGGVVGGTGIVVDPPMPVPAPVIVAPGIDPRYADALQPSYPAEERRAGAEGRVVVRVLVGTDGRVKDVVRVSAASDAFWRATEDQARRRWRFKPGTRDGVPVEAWRTMTLTFRLEG